MICKVPYPAWMFFVYALPVCSIICIVFTSLWWGILWQGVSVSALIWTLGLSLYLSFELENVSLIFLVCAALQVLTVLWEVFRKFLLKSKGLPDGGDHAGQPKRMTWRIRVHMGRNAEGQDAARLCVTDVYIAQNRKLFVGDCFNKELFVFLVVHVVHRLSDENAGDRVKHAGFLERFERLL